jgi:hypothetical protein
MQAVGLHAQKNHRASYAGLRDLPTKQPKKYSADSYNKTVIIGQ